MCAAGVKDTTSWATHFELRCNAAPWCGYGGSGDSVIQNKLRGGLLSWRVLDVSSLGNSGHIAMLSQNGGTSNLGLKWLFLGDTDRHVEGSSLCFAWWVCNLFKDALASYQVIRGLASVCGYVYLVPLVLNWRCPSGCLICVVRLRRRNAQRTPGRASPV